MTTITFYGLVLENKNVYKPFHKVKSFSEAKQVRNNCHNIIILKYKGYERKVRGKKILVIQEIL